MNQRAFPGDGTPNNLAVCWSEPQDCSVIDPIVTPHYLYRNYSGVQAEGYSFYPLKTFSLSSFVVTLYLFHWNTDHDRSHDIIDFEIPFGALRVGIMAADTTLGHSKIRIDGLEVTGVS